MKHKSPLEEDWLDIAKDWQAQPYEQADINKLIVWIKSTIIKSKCLLGLNVLASIALAVALMFGFKHNWDTPLMVYLGFGVVASGIFVFYEYKIRSVTWRYKQTSPQEVMQSVAENYHASIAYMNLNIFGFLISLPPANWFIYTTAATHGKSPMKPMIVANLLIIGAIVAIYIFKRARIKKLKELNAKIAFYFDNA